MYPTWTYHIAGLGALLIVPAREVTDTRWPTTGMPSEQLPGSRGSSGPFTGLARYEPTASAVGAGTCQSTPGFGRWHQLPVPPIAAWGVGQSVWLVSLTLKHRSPKAAIGGTHQG